MQAYCNHIYLQRSQKSKNKRGQLVPNIFARNRKADFSSSLRDSVCCLSLGTQARYAIFYHSDSSVQSCDFDKIQMRRVITRNSECGCRHLFLIVS